MLHKTLKPLPVWRVRFLLRRTLGHDRRAQARTQIIGQLVELRVTIDFDRLLGRIADNIAVVAPRQMIVQFGLGPRVEHAIQVVR